MFFDVHAHLLDEAFNADREQVIKACAEKNIMVFENGLDYKSNNECLELSRKHDNVFCLMGCFPSNSFDERILDQVRSNKRNIIGVGEVGLDLKYENVKEQEVVFKRIIVLAEELGLPMIVHSRKAHKRVVEMLSGVRVPVVLHAFFASKKNVLSALDNPNLFFSVPTSVFYGDQYQWIVKNTDISRLLCETDSPYLWKFERNTPLNIIKVYEKIAELKNLSVKEVERVIEANVRLVFKKI